MVAERPVGQSDLRDQYDRLRRHGGIRGGGLFGRPDCRWRLARRHPRRRREPVDPKVHRRGLADTHQTVAGRSRRQRHQSERRDHDRCSRLRSGADRCLRRRRGGGRGAQPRGLGPRHRAAFRRLCDPVHDRQRHLRGHSDAGRGVHQRHVPGPGVRLQRGSFGRRPGGQRHAHEHDDEPFGRGRLRGLWRPRERDAHHGWSHVSRTRKPARAESCCRWSNDGPSDLSQFALHRPGAGHLHRDGAGLGYERQLVLRGSRRRLQRGPRHGPEADRFRHRDRRRHEPAAVRHDLDGRSHPAAGDQGSGEPVLCDGDPPGVEPTGRGWLSGQAERGHHRLVALAGFPRVRHAEQRPTAVQRPGSAAAQPVARRHDHARHRPCGTDRCLRKAFGVHAAGARAGPGDVAGRCFLRPPHCVRRGPQGLPHRRQLPHEQGDDHRLRCGPREVLRRVGPCLAEGRRLPDRRRFEDSAQRRDQRHQRALGRLRPRQ